MNDIQGWINLYKTKNITSFKSFEEFKDKFLQLIDDDGTSTKFAIF